MPPTNYGKGGQLHRADSPGQSHLVVEPQDACCSQTSDGPTQSPRQNPVGNTGVENSDAEEGPEEVCVELFLNFMGKKTERCTPHY